MYYSIDIGIFKHTVIVFLGDTDDTVISEMNKYGYSENDISESLSLVEYSIGRCVLLDGGYVIVRIGAGDKFNSHADMLSTVLHESNHAAMYILDKIGMRVEVGISDEILCYLQAYIFENIIKQIQINNKLKTSHCVGK